ncbi:MAG: phosphoserine phosphatase SerB [Rhizobiales bacterium]|nr:phosphoserine phosphatase SerB [Hyphomicrobiales bacterium]
MPAFAIIAAAARPDASLIDRAADLACQGLGAARIAGPRTLSPGRACEVTGELDTIADGQAIVARMRQLLQGEAIDINCLPIAGRPFQLLVVDMESTIIQQECLDELAEFVGQRKAVEAITERAMRGEVDFEAALTERVGLLAGLEVERLVEVLEQRVTLMPGAEHLLATMREAGVRCALVSGGFAIFAEPIAKRLGFDTYQANRLGIAGGRLTGEVMRPILGRAAKRAALERLAREHGVALESAIAIGDGANDLDMLGAAGLGIAFRAKPKVAEAAAARIDHCDLECVLFLQGIRQTAGGRSDGQTG